MKKRTALDPESGETASTHLLGQTNNGLNCNHDKKRGMGVCLGAGRCILIVFKSSKSSSKVYYNDRKSPMSPLVFLTPPLATYLWADPLVLLLFLCGTWGLLPVDGKSLCHSKTLHCVRVWMEETLSMWQSVLVWRDDQRLNTAVALLKEANTVRATPWV